MYHIVTKYYIYFIINGIVVFLNKLKHGEET